jgi:hypothetical protein
MKVLRDLNNKILNKTLAKIKIFMTEDNVPAGKKKI